MKTRKRMTNRVFGLDPLNGRFTNSWKRPPVVSYEDAKPQEASNYWSSSEYNTTNAWNLNFNSGNVNNNNKYNTNNIARGVAAFGGFQGLPANRTSA